VNKNTRSLEMFGFVDAVVWDWYNRVIVDMGCGWGDMTFNALRCGAKHVLAIDKDEEAIRITREKCAQWENTDRFRWVLGPLGGINDCVRILRPADFSAPNTFFCFSVLPYLESIHSMLFWMARQDAESFIEMQYAGDGPGPSWVKDDQDMYNVLTECGFTHAEPIGYTMVKEDRWKRTIWQCKGK